MFRLGKGPLYLTKHTSTLTITPMKRDLAGINKHLIAGVLLVLAIVGLSALAIHAPDQKSAARSLNNIQTDKVTLLYAAAVPKCNWFVEQVLAGTSESKDATENLKLVAATL